ncbi:MAG TPA: hypothetical protein VF832_01220 [Longimicrobiales bacterium]
MDKIRTKEAAEATLRELPSVIGAFVREDVYGHPREVHLLVQPGPNVRLLAHDVRDLLEERLQVPIDQRIISIAQVARDPRESPVETVPEVAPGADAVDDGSGEPRLVFSGVESMFRDARVVVRVRVSYRGEEFTGEAAELDAGSGRVRAAAAAALRAAAAAARDTVRLELDGAAGVRAFERDYVLVSALAVSPALGRRPLPLVGAQLSEGDASTAAALAALKAVNRVVARRLRALKA